MTVQSYWVYRKENLQSYFLPCEEELVRSSKLLVVHVEGLGG